MSGLPYERLEAEALKLPSTAKARLAQQLLASMEPVAEAEIDRLWLDEAERRDRQLDAGQSSVPIEQVLEKARSAIK